MDLKQIEKLIALMDRMGMKRISIKEEGLEIELERETPFYAMGAVTMPTIAHSPMPAQQIDAKAHSVEEQSAKASKEEGKFVTSPMVGTYYSSSSPDAPPFAKVGDKVDAKSVVCIVEAMKVMNEIKAGVSGTISEVLINNGEPVEFGSKLFKII